MHLSIQGRHLLVTPSLNQYVKEKIKKIKFYFDHILHAHVILEVIKDNQFAEVTVTVEHHHFHNRVASEDMYKSIDLLFDKLETQVRRYKEFHQNHHRPKNVMHLGEIDETKESRAVNIVDIQIQTKPMDALEAALQLSMERKVNYFGFLDTDHSLHPSFLVKEGDRKFKLIDFEDHWELRNVELIHKEKLETHSIESMRFPTEAIEDAISFIEENDANHRFFESVRAKTCMLLFKIKDKQYGVIRQNPM